MLRAKRNTRQGPGKRNSMFLDSFSLDIPSSNVNLAGESKNTSSEHSWMRPRKESKAKTRPEVSKPLQRSSLVLDTNMVREYNLALKHLGEEKETRVERSGSDSNISLSESDTSPASSIFDKTGVSKNEESASLRAIFFSTDEEHVPSDTTIMSKGKSLIQIYDSNDSRRVLSKEIIHQSVILQDDQPLKYERTALEF